MDEIGDMPLEMQAKLLRVLENKRFSPIGGEDEIEVDVRVVAATNKNLPKMVAEGLFREDLFYRLTMQLRPVPNPTQYCNDNLSLRFQFELFLEYWNQTAGLFHTRFPKERF